MILEGYFGRVIVISYWSYYKQAFAEGCMYYVQPVHITCEKVEAVKYRG